MILQIIFYTFYGYGNLMIDSRYDSYKQFELNQFDKEFSIWFTFHSSNDQNITTIFRILNQDYLLIHLWAQQNKLQVSFNQGQVIEIKDQKKIAPNEWFHLIVNQTQLLENDEFILNFTAPWIKEYSIKIDKNISSDIQFIISVEFSMLIFCLIYDSVTYEIEPIIKSSNMQQIINPYDISLYQYYQDSYIELFLQQELQVQLNYAFEILVVKYQSLSLFKIWQNNNNIEIYVSQGNNYSRPVNSWFRIFIQFSLNNTYIQLQFLNEIFQIPLQNYNGEDIFYEIYLISKLCNYRFIKFTEFFKVKNIESFIIQNIYSLNNCSLGVITYFDFDSNDCFEIIYFNEIKIVENDNQQLDISQLNELDQDFDQIGRIILNQLLSNLEDYEKVPFLEFYESQKYDLTKEPFILWKYQNYIFCNENYFGNQCQKFIKRCLKAKYQICKHCQDGYQLIQSRCIKCPLNCLICQLMKSKHICLLPQQNYYINRFYQIKFCVCDYCNAFGQCVTSQEINNQINQCFGQQKCILKFCDFGNEQFSLAFQKCIQLQYDQLTQLEYYLIYLDKYYYQKKKIQFIILQNFQIYGDFILNSQILSNYYKIVQIIHNKVQLFNNQLIKQPQFFISYRYNLKCVELKINQFGEYVCRKYVNYVNNKCLKLPCIYDLEISGITCLIGVKSYFEHNKFYYSTIKDLLESIKHFNLKFNKIYLEINLIFQTNTNNQFDWNEKFDFKFKPFYYEDQFIEIDLKFSSNQNYARNFLELNIIADKIKIQNESLNFILILHLEIQEIFINNLIIDHQGLLKINAQNSGYSKFSQLLIRGQLILVLSKFEEIKIQDYKSLGDSLTSFNLVNIRNFDLQQAQIEIKQINVPLMVAYNIITLNMINVTIRVDQLKSSELYYIAQITYLILIDFNLIGDSINDSCLFYLEDIYYQNIEQFQIKINKFISSTFLDFFSGQLQINNIQLSIGLMKNSNCLIIKSQELRIENFFLNSQIIQQSQIINIQTNILILKSIQIQQISSIFQENENNPIKTYLVTLLMRQNSLIENLNMTGIQLFDNGLLQIQTLSQITIFKLSISLIQCFNNYFSKFIVFQGYTNSSKIKILGLFLQKITIETNIKMIFNLIEVQDFVTVEFIDQNIIDIVSSNNNSISNIFQFNCQRINLDMITVYDCINIDFINIEAISFQIQNLKYINNFQQRVIFRLKNTKTNYLIIQNSTISLKNQIFLYIETTQNLLVFIQHLFIDVQAIDNYFIMAGLGLDISLQNIIINYNELKFERSDNFTWLFQIYDAKIFMKNVFIRNLQFKIFLFDSLSIIIMQNIVLVNINQRLNTYLIDVFNSSLIINKFQVISIQNCLGVFFITKKKNLVLFQELYFQDIINVDFLLTFNSDTKKRIIMRDISIKGLQRGQLFSFYLYKQQQLQINRLFIDNVDKFQSIGQFDKLTIQNSIIEVNFFLYDKQFLQLINTEIIVNQSLSFRQIQFDRSYFFYYLKPYFIQDISFLITLSFSGQRYLKSIKLHSSKELQFMVSQDGSQQYFFYVPSGQKVEEYKQLNLQSHSYEQIFQGFYLVIQGFLFGQINYELKCSQIQYYNNVIINKRNFDNLQIQEGFNQINEQIFIINPQNDNYTVFEITCFSNINEKQIQLYYNAKALPCQLGEYLFQSQCLECNLNQSQYSVTLNSTKCNYVDYSLIREVKKGLIKVNQKYWRHSYYSDIIEYCDSIDCDGGWIPGDKSCVKSRVGALCKECDLYNTRGDGYFTNNDQRCQLCQGFDMKFIMKLLFTILWQLLVVLNGYYSNYKLSQQYLMFRVGFRQYYQILYRQSIDQPNIFLKIFINYIFMLYIIRQNLDLIGQIFISNINIVNNPGLILKAQLDCLMSQVFQLEIIYSQYIYQIIQVFLVLSLTYTIYFIIMQVQKLRFQIGIILYFTDAILIYNLNLIIDISCNLLSYQVASGQKWIKQNMQYHYYSDQHQTMIQYIIPITFIFFMTPFMFPFAMKNISIFNRLAKRIYAVYHQEFKPQFNFWEYLIIYTKYTLLIFQIMDSQSNQYGIIFIWSIIFLNSNFKPYYLQNLNQFELNLFYSFGIQLNLLVIGDHIDLIIILFNVGIFIYFVQKFYQSFYILNLSKIIQWKKQLIEKQNWLKRFSGIEKNERLLSNKRLLINLIRIHIMQKQQTQYYNQSRVQTETEIELGIIIKQVQSKIYPSRQEPINS